MAYKNLHYLCLIGVIALGLMTIVGSNGGGGGETALDTIGDGNETPLVGTAVTIMKPNWYEEIIYDHPLIFPEGITLDGDGNLLIVSKGNQKILRLSTEGQFSTYLDTSSLTNVSAIAYQPGLGRLIITANHSALYAFSNEQLTTLQSSGVLFGGAGYIAVKTADDSFYTCSQSEASSINHYDCDGNLISTIVTDLERCFQMALDETNNKLYYTEMVAGRITEVNLASNSKTIIATEVGVPGTSEPIALAFDGSNNLYYYTADMGLNRYDGGPFAKIMDGKSGVGLMTWSPFHSAFLMGTGTGANMTAFDPASATATDLTQYVNGRGIVEMDDGTVLICDPGYWEDRIQKVANSGLSPFTDKMESPCQSLERDSNGNIYAGMTDGSIWKILPDGSTTLWASGFSSNTVASLQYDSKNNAMITFTGNSDTSTATIWRIPLDTPADVTKVLELSDVLINTYLPAGTVDDSGNIYLLERKANVIFKIADGSNTPTIFASSVLDSDAISVPNIEYLSHENALLVSTIDNYEMWSVDNPTKSIFATNNGGVDNLGINETKDGNLIAIHSGRVFRVVYSSS